MARQFQQPNFDPMGQRKQEAQQQRQALEGIPALLLQYGKLKNQRHKEKFDAATERVKNQIELLKLGRTQDVIGKDGKPTSIPGITGWEIAIDAEGLPTLKQTEGVTPTPGSAGVKIQPPEPATNLFGTVDESGKMTEPPVDLGPGKLTVGKPQNSNDAMLENRNASLEMRRIPPLPAGENKEISDMDASRNELRKLIANAKDTGFGSGNPLVERGRAAIWNPFDPNSQKFKQYIAQTKQIIGKALEGGVLRKEDETKYEAIIPRAGDTTDIIIGKADQLDKMISDRQNIRVENFKKAFRNVPEPKTMEPIIGTDDPVRKEAVDMLTKNGKIVNEQTVKAAMEFVKKRAK